MALSAGAWLAKGADAEKSVAGNYDLGVANSAMIDSGIKLRFLR
jgi:hypothetical protein